MRSLLRHRPSPSMVVALLALFVALGGGAYAATQINGKLIKKNSEPGNRINKKTFVAKARFATNATHASNADTAKNAVHATAADNAVHATNADNATNATNATNAGNASSLGGQPASAYMPNSATQRGTFILATGTTGKTLFSNGPLSVTADCTSSAGTLTLTVTNVSTADNWLDFASVVPAAGTSVNSSRNDGGTGNESGSTNRIDLTAPGGQALRGQITFGVNWPSAGQCFVSGWVIAI